MRAFLVNSRTKKIHSIPFHKACGMVASPYGERLVEPEEDAAWDLHRRGFRNCGICWPRSRCPECKEMFYRRDEYGVCTDGRFYCFQCLASDACACGDHLLKEEGT